MDYLPLYKSNITISKEFPALSVLYGNSSAELQVFYKNSLISGDLGNFTLEKVTQREIINFWFINACKWFPFYLSEFSLDRYESSLTERFSFFRSVATNVYQLFVSTNRVEKRIYLPKNMVISSNPDITYLPGDYSFFSTINLEGKQITGSYDVPVIFKENSIKFELKKEVKLSGLSFREILLNETVKTPISFRPPVTLVL